LLGAWELVGRTVGGLLFPSFTATLAALAGRTWDGRLTEAFLASNIALALGYGLAFAVGIPLGLAMGRSRLADRLAGPYLQVMLVIPVIALVPLVLILLGLSFSARAAIVFLFSLPQFTFNVRAGIRSIEPGLLEMARSFGARRLFLWTGVLLPGAIPGILAGVWSSIGRAISGMIVAELTIVSPGLGHMIRSSMDGFEAPTLFAVTLVLAAEGIGLTYAARALAGRMMPYRPEAI
jgi:ABC-type nitrate/sulfonate/bicarbonate transport system permease component